MTPAQFRAEITARGYSVNKAAAALGLASRTLRYYLSGSRPIPRPVQLALKTLERRA